MAQITDTILMVRPKHFGYDPETADNNAFQKDDHSMSEKEIERKATEEFDSFVKKLRSVGINIIVIEDTDAPKKLDAVFPNNWFTTHENGALVTYPLFAPNRRAERREDLLSQLNTEFEVKIRVHLEEWEDKNLFLEGTGSMILDREHKLAYACRSARTDKKVFEHFSEFTKYEMIFFDASDDNGQAIYHTNVMMAIGETFSTIVLDAIKDIEERHKVIDALEESEKEIIELSMDQMLSFAGNMLQVKSTSGETYLVMSTAAYESLEEDQIERINAHTNILHSAIPTLEMYGGGSVRCMMAEIFLPKKDLVLDQP